MKYKAENNTGYSLRQILVSLALVVGLIIVTQSLTRGFGKVANIEVAPTRIHELVSKTAPQGVIELVKVSNADSNIFPEGLKIELRNISKKPIYTLAAVLILPDTKAVLGNPIGLFTMYGSKRLIKLTELASSEDKAVKPGDSFTLTIDALRAGGLRKAIAEKKIPFSSTMRLGTFIQLINFGDGSGFFGGEAFSKEKIVAKAVNSEDLPSPSVIGGLRKPYDLNTAGTNLASNLYNKSNLVGALLHVQTGCEPVHIEVLPSCDLDYCQIPQAVPGGAGRKRCPYLDFCGDPVTGEYINCQGDYLASCGPYDCFYY